MSAELSFRMTFDPRQIEARISLNLIPPKEMPPIAWAALEAGHDGQAIRRMAAFDNPTGFETDRFLPAFMKETGMSTLSRERASLRVAYDKARQILDCRNDPLASADFFEKLWVRADYPREMQELGMMSDEIYLAESFGQTRDDVRRTMKDKLILFVRDFETISEK